MALSPGGLPSEVSSGLINNKPMQYALAASSVLVVGVVVFALAWSIIQGTPFNPVASTVLSFILGTASGLLGSQAGATIHSRGIKTSLAVIDSATYAGITPSGGGANAATA